MTRRPFRSWYECVSWKRSATGALHAQWLDEDEEGASVHSTESALSGPALPYDSALACRRCCELVRNVYMPLHFAGGHQARKGASGGYVGNSQAQREMARTKLARILEAAKVHTITSETLVGWWPEMSRGAANAILARAMRAKKLRRIAPGEYGR